MKTSALGLAVLLLVGCVASTEQLAQQGDWQQIGYQDGIAGHTQRPLWSIL